ncbi:MAG: HAD family hydrolase [Aquificaceae bacterium]
MKGVVFDVDGVIIDVRDSYHVAIKNTAEELAGKEVDINLVRSVKFEKAINNDWLATLEVIRHLGEKADLRDVIETFNRVYKYVRDQERLLLNGNFFKRLRSLGVKLGIVTGRPKEDLLYSFERFHLKEYFDFMVDDDDIEQEELKKPHPYALHVCIEGMNLDACVYVGDSLADWQMVYYYKKMYEKPVEYIHFGENVKPKGVFQAKHPEGLILALQEVLPLL